MNIGIDGNEANVTELVGVSVYTKSLLNYFAQHADTNTQFTIFLRDEPLPSLPKETEFFRYEVVPGKLLWSQVFLPIRLLRQRDIDVFFSPAHYTPRFCPVPVVVTIHDLSYFYFPNEFLRKDLYKLKNWTQRAVSQAEKIIAVSKHTKKDVLKQYPVNESKVTVIYNGYRESDIDVPKKQQQSILSNYNLRTTNYVLYVGTLQPRKNIQSLIEAFKRVSETNTELKLVLVGKKGWLYEEIFEEVQKNNLNDKVIFTGYVDDETLDVLYENAFCYVLPSLYEGFGIPILEAMSHGCPVISSFSSSLPEIGGDACLYFEPTDSKGLAERLQQLSSNTNVRKDLIKKGKEQVKKFAWEKCGKETLQLIMSAAKPA